MTLEELIADEYVVGHRILEDGGYMLIYKQVFNYKLTRSEPNDLAGFSEFW